MVKPLTKSTAKYGVFHDLPKASPIKIHSSHCYYYRTHDPSAPTTDWYYTNTLKEATSIAKQLSQKHKMKYRDCLRCNPSHN